MSVGIVSYGVYVPRYRIALKDIAKVWREDGDSISRGLGVIEKAVPALDEDTITISVEAALNALNQAPFIDPSEIGAIYVGSESHPYAVKPTAVTVAEAIGAAPVLTSADLEFACKAGTAGMQMVFGLVTSGQIKYGMAIGTDCAQGRPGDALEYTAGAGGAAFLIGADHVIAELEGTYSYTTDTPDFFRREGEKYPMHGWRFTGKPAYFKHVISATKGLMEQLELTIDDIDWVAFHTPNAKFPVSAAKMLGFPLEKMQRSLPVREIGNTYSGSSMVALANILDVAEPGQRILVTSFGSGAGSDSFSFIVTEEIKERRGKVPGLEDYIRYKQNIDYGEYVRFRRKLTT